MKNKKVFGFTLIELVVAIVIIGILATISASTFRGYFAQARDAKRKVFIQSAATAIKAGYLDADLSAQYDPADGNEIEGLLTANGISIPTEDSPSRCYIFGFDDSGSANEFFLAVGMEEDDTAIAVDGTIQGISDANTETAAILALDCSALASDADVPAALTAVGSYKGVVLTP